MIYGIGINDADYTVQPKVGTKQVRCPYYKVWRHMLMRCYSHQYLQINPTYKDCEVCLEWLSFMSFRSWMKTQDWENKQLDKDLLGNGKLYSPETCCFVEQWLNKLFNTNEKKRGKYPIGVSFLKVSKKFESNIILNGKKKRLGLFDTPKEAHQVYLKAKRDYVTEKMNGYPNQQIKQAVLNKVNKPCECEWCK